MRIIQVIESLQWRNKRTGATASVYGAAPYVSDADAKDWETEAVGFTWRNDNGTVGLGRMPAKTREEAEAIMREFNDRMDSFKSRV